MRRMGPLWIYQGRPSYLGKSSLTQAQSYVDAGYTPEQTQIVLGSKSMSTVKQYCDMEKIEIRRNLLNKVVKIEEAKNKKEESN